jgi:hypothetical protein
MYKMGLAGRSPYGQMYYIAAHPRTAYSHAYQQVLAPKKMLSLVTEHILEKQHTSHLRAINSASSSDNPAL